MLDTAHLPFDGYQGESPYVFVSYAHLDAAVVYPEMQWLHESGIRIWYDDGIEAGTEWPENIAEAIDNCAFFVVFISENSVRSRNVRNEINYALNRGKKLLAFNLGEAQLPKGLQLRIGDIQAVSKRGATPISYRQKMLRVLPKIVRRARDEGPANQRDLGIDELHDDVVAPSLKSPQVNLPAQLTSFIGRKHEVQSVQELLEQRRLVTLLGPGGCGKTRLAIQAATECTHLFPDGICFVELGDLESAAGLERTVASALRIAPDPSMSPRDNIVRSLTDKKQLAILDNCEHIVEAVKTLATDLLKSLPNLTLLATSRRVLGVRGEHSHPVPPLTRPLATASSPAHILSSESVQLLVERAKAKCPGFEVTESNAKVLAALCVDLEGMPLAIELAASRLRVLSPEQLYSRLSERLDLLKNTSDSSDARHQTLRATVQWSYDLLDEEEQALLCRLSLLPSGCNLSLAELVADDLFDDPLDVLDYVENLVNNSLLQVDSKGPLRYRMLESIRQYCSERVTSEVREAAFNKIVPWATEFAGRTKGQLIGADPRRVLNEVEADYENLRACLIWLQKQPDPENRLLDLAGELDRYWFRTGTISDGTEWLELALKNEAGSPITRAVALRSAGTFACELGRLDSAEKLLTQSVDILRGLNDNENLSGAINNLGLLLCQSGQYERAKASFLEALQLARDSGSEALTGAILQNLGNLERDQSHLEGAMSYLSQALQLVESKEEGRYTQAVILSNMADIDRQEGRFESATRRLLQSVELSKELRNPQILGRHILNLAQVAYSFGQAEAACKLWACAVSAPGYTPSPENTAESNELREGLRASLDAKSLEEAVSISGQMSLDELAEFALKVGRSMHDQTF